MTLSEAAQNVLETRKTNGNKFPNDDVAQFLDASWMLLEAAMDGEDIRQFFKE